MTTGNDGQPEPRIHPAKDLTEQQQELLQKTQMRGETLNVFATMVHNPTVMKRVSALGGYFVAQGLLEERDRELVILRTAYRTGCEYEFGRHTARVLHKQLLSEEQLRAIATEPLSAFDDVDAALLRFVDDVCANDAAADDFPAMAARFDEAELTELLLLIGFYRMLAGYMNTVRIRREDGIPGFPS